MTKEQHIKESVRLLAQVDQVQRRSESRGFEADPRELDRLVAMAHVHALLARVAPPGFISDETEV